MSSLKIGETVVCPDCQEDIANVCKDLHPGDKIDVTHFDFKPGHELTDGTPRCNKCGGLWILYGNKILIKNRGLVP